MIFHCTNYYDKDTAICIDDATITIYNVLDCWFMNFMNSKMDVKSKYLNSCLVFLKYFFQEDFKLTILYSIIVIVKFDVQGISS